MSDYIKQNNSTKWEYLCVEIFLDTGELQEKLNELGNQGWEAFSVTPVRTETQKDEYSETYSNAAYKVCVYMKRSFSLVNRFPMSKRGIQ